jgi:integrase
VPYIRDRWTDANPDGPDARPRRVHNARWGRGKRWQAVWTDAAGKRQARACTSKDEAEKVVRDRDGRQAQSGPVPLDRWLHDWAAGQLHWSGATRESASIAIDGMILPSLRGETVQSLTRARVQAAVTEWAGTWAASTIRARWGWLSGPMGQAVADGLIDRNPCTGVRLPSVERPVQFFPTLAQVVAIRQAMTPRLQTMVTVAAGTGMRSAELRGLTWDRISGRVITVDRQLARGSGLSWGPVKNRRPRTVTVGDSVADALAEQLERWGPGAEGLVWHSRTRWDGPISPRAAGEGWRNATAGMGFPERTGWHCLRHLHASLLIHSGMSPRAVADRLGHADVAETLRTYSHLWPSDDAQAAAVFDDAMAAVSDKGATRDFRLGAD